MHTIPDAALSQHIAILGKTGSGKTSTEKLAIEHVVAEGFRVCVLDTLKSDWWGITSSADGKRPGFPFRILGGPRGHVPLHSSAGKVIGQLVGSGKLPLSIVDMADFEAGGIQRFFVDFAQALWKSVRGVVYLVIEEAHEIAPKERAGFGAENLSIHWAKKLATGSRTKGIRLVVATQRAQALHNAVLGSCETLIAHRLTLDADQEPVIKWLKNANKVMAGEVAETLTSLPNGTGWLCSGEAQLFKKVAFPKFKTYDNTATPTGDGAEVDVKTAPVDQDELRAIIGDAVKEAEADDPKKLRLEIAKRDRALSDMERTMRAAAAGKIVADPKAIEAAEQRGFERAKKELAAAADRELQATRAALLQKFGDAIGPLMSLMKEEAQAARAKPQLAKQLTFTPSPALTIGRETVVGNGQARGPGYAPVPKPAAVPAGDETLTGPQRRLIEALKFWAAVGHERPSREMVAAIADYSARSGSFRNVVSSLNVAGLIEADGAGRLALTASGQAVDVGEIDARSRLDNRLGGPERKIITALLAADELERGVIADQAGYSAESGSFRNTLSALHVKDVIEYPSRGTVRMTEWARQVLAA